MATIAYSDITQHTKKIDGRPLSPEEVKDLYKEWAELYEKDLETLNYTGYKYAAKYFAQYAEKYGLPKDMKILDVGAGTGLLALELKNKYGFTNIDAVDGSQEMLDKAEKLGVYEKCVTSWIGGGNKMPFPDCCYDAAVGAGIFAPSHIPLDGMDDIARVVKPGGLFVNAMRRAWTQPGTCCEGFHGYIKKLEKEEVWEHVADIIPEEKYYLDYECLVSVLRLK